MNLFKRLCLLFPFVALCDSLATSTNKNTDTAYPWSFTGRLWFRPALVRVPTIENMKPLPPPSISILSLFGWTIGGVVALDYDESPVGPYREYVTMGALVSKRGAVGQWGSRLYVSNDEAERICQEIWKVPAEVANIDFLEGSNTSGQTALCVKSAPDPIVTIASPAPGGEDMTSKSGSPLDFFQSMFDRQNPTTATTNSKQNIVVDGWATTRTLENPSKNVRRGGIPVLWTPSIKALWAPFVPFPSSDKNDDDKLPLHRLRLSASAVRLHFCGQDSSDLLGVPIPLGLSIDNVLIEIDRQFDEL